MFKNWAGLLTLKPYILYDPAEVINRMWKDSFFTGCLKRSRYKAPEIPRNEAYIEVRRNDEG